MTSIINPIDDVEQEHVVQVTQSYLQIAADLFNYPYQAVPVYFDLKGSAAGMYQMINHQRMIRFNPYIFAKYFDDSLKTTVPHEVAHYVSDKLFGMNNIQPHGREWKAIMSAFGANTSATGNYDLEGIPVRRYKRYKYQCDCRDHELTSIRHNKIQRGEMNYLCRFCKASIRLSTEQHG